MLNTLRHVVNDDDKWWKLILDYSEHFKKQVIETNDVVGFFNKETGMNLTPIFNQYLRYKDIPVLQLKLNKGNLEYRWQTDVADFQMPIEISAEGRSTRLSATNKWQSIKTNASALNNISVASTKFYIKVERL
jgi:aminopeptidase N